MTDEQRVVTLAGLAAALRTVYGPVEADEDLAPLWAALPPASDEGLREALEAEIYAVRNRTGTFWEGHRSGLETALILLKIAAGSQEAGE